MCELIRKKKDVIVFNSGYISMSMKPLKSNIFYSDVVKTSDMGPGSLYNNITWNEAMLKTFSKQLDM